MRHRASRSPFNAKSLQLLFNDPLLDGVPSSLEYRSDMKSSSKDSKIDDAFNVKEKGQQQTNKPCQVEIHPLYSADYISNYLVDKTRPSQPQAVAHQLVPVGKRVATASWPRVDALEPVLLPALSFRAASSPPLFSSLSQEPLEVSRRLEVRDSLCAAGHLIPLSVVRLRLCYPIVYSAARKVDRRAACQQASGWGTHSGLRASLA